MQLQWSQPSVRTSSCAGMLQGNAMPASVDWDSLLPGVVMVRVAQSWATGVVASGDGIVVTNAHLFDTGQGSTTGTSQAAHSQVAGLGGSSKSRNGGSSGQDNGSSRGSNGVLPVAGTLPCWVRIATGSAPVSFQWVLAQVLHIFTGYLDLAVLRVAGMAEEGKESMVHVRNWEGDARLKHSAALPGRQQLQCLELADKRTPQPGDNLWVVGHGLFGPKCQWLPSVTFGSVARVVPVQGRPSMLITTAAVYSGASGGAVVDGAGRLCGIVTSNAKHSAGATLPHLNFCIAAEELRSLWVWAGGVGGSKGKGTVGGVTDLDVACEEGKQVWALRAPGVEPPRPAHSTKMAQLLNKQHSRL
jgi:hypothetical protein